MHTPLRPSRPLSVAAALVLLPGAVAARQACEIIDVHQHANPAPESFVTDPPARYCPNGVRPCALGVARYRTSEALLEGTLEAMDRNGITMAFVSTYDLEHLDRWLDRAPDRFRGGVSWSPGIDEPDGAALRARYARGRLAYVGELAGQYAGLPPSDPALAPYFDLAAELDVPVLVHMTAVGGTSDDYSIEAGRPTALEPVLKARPGLRVYLENSGYPFAEDMIAMFAQHPNVYGDLSRISWWLPREAFHDYVRTLVRAGYADRLMFGSDQSWWPEVIDDAVEAVRSADFLTPEQSCAILGGNARRFFRLEGGDAEGADTP